MAELPNVPRFRDLLRRPVESPLFRFGREILGRDVATGEELSTEEQPPAMRDGISADRWRQITASPRQYGFHATLKPPFHLAAGRTADDLVVCLERFVTGRQPFETAPLRLARISNFLALVLRAESPALSDLANACVCGFDDFRAPAGPEELARRKSASPDTATADAARRLGLSVRARGMALSHDARQRPRARRGRSSARRARGSRHSGVRRAAAGRRRVPVRATGGAHAVSTRQAIPIRRQARLNGEPGLSRRRDGHRARGRRTARGRIRHRRPRRGQERIRSRDGCRIHASGWPIIRPAPWAEAFPTHRDRRGEAETPSAPSIASLVCRSCWTALSISSPAGCSRPSRLHGEPGTRTRG